MRTPTSHSAHLRPADPLRQPPRRPARAADFRNQAELVRASLLAGVSYKRA